MATRIVSWGGDSHTVSPSLSNTPSIVSVDSILPDKPQAIQSAPCAAESRVKQVASQVIEPNGTRTLTAAGMYHGPDTVDGSFVQHHKYFFTDGNVTFLVDNTLYCVHRYFFSRDSIYFSTRFALLNIRDHEALPTIISLGDIARDDFDAFLSILYPENFEQNDLTYEEWKSVLHLSTRWGFASLRKLALGSIEPPMPHDRLLLARKYSVDDWVVPALSELCKRTAPLTLSEARQMDIEDVILVSTVREDIRSRTLQVDPAEIPRRVEAEQAWTLTGCRPKPIQVPPVFPTSVPSSPMDLKGSTKEDGARESNGEHSTGENALGNTSVRKEPTQHIKNGWGAAAPTPTVKTGALTSTALNIATQLADDVAAKRTAAKRRAVEAAARLEQAEMVMKREAEEAAMALRSWGKGGGWMAKAATEQKVKTSDPSVLPVGSSWGSSIKGRSA